MMMLCEKEFAELISLIQLVELGGEADPSQKRRKTRLEKKALKPQLLAARYAAKYPALAGHMRRATHPVGYGQNGYAKTA